MGQTVLLAFRVDLRQKSLSIQVFIFGVPKNNQIVDVITIYDCICVFSDCGWLELGFGAKSPVFIPNIDSCSRFLELEMKTDFILTRETRTTNTEKTVNYFVKVLNS